MDVVTTRNSLYDLHQGIYFSLYCLCCIILVVIWAWRRKKNNWHQLPNVIQNWISGRVIKGYQDYMYFLVTNIFLFFLEEVTKFWITYWSIQISRDKLNVTRVYSEVILFVKFTDTRTYHQRMRYKNVCCRSCHRRCSIKKGFLRNFAKFTGKHLLQSLFFNKVVGLQVCNFIKKEALAQMFSCEFCKFLRTPLLQNTSGQLLLMLG